MLGLVSPGFDSELRVQLGRNPGDASPSLFTVLRNDSFRLPSFRPSDKKLYRPPTLYFARMAFSLSMSIAWVVRPPAVTDVAFVKEL